MSVYSGMYILDYDLFFRPAELVNARKISCTVHNLNSKNDSMMITLRPIVTTLLLLFALQSMALAQSTDITEVFKKHFNETVQEVQQTDDAEDKRVILNESFNKMITALDRIESRANLTEDEQSQLNSFRSDIAERQNELNGLDGFDEIVDEDLDDFSNFSQDFMEQANRTITIGASTLVLIIILLLLL